MSQLRQRWRASRAALYKGRPEVGGGTTSAGRYTSVYYEQQAVVKHPELIDDAWIERVINQPDRIAINTMNETISYWGYVPEFGYSLRVILREIDGTLVNRFPDSKETRKNLGRESQP